MTLVDIRVGLRAYLLGSGAIAALVGQRVYPIKLPQGITASSIVYTKISGLGDHHMQGPSGLARNRVQVDSWAATGDAATALALLVKERLDGFHGSMLWGSNSPQASVTVRGIFFDNENEFYDDTAKLYRASQDYFVWYAES